MTGCMVLWRRAADQRRTGPARAGRGLRCETSHHPSIARRTLQDESIVEGVPALTNGPATDSIRVRVEPASTRSVRVPAMQTMPPNRPKSGFPLRSRGVIEIFDSNPFR